MKASRGIAAMLSTLLALPAQSGGAAGALPDVAGLARAALDDGDCQPELPTVVPSAGTGGERRPTPAPERRGDRSGTPASPPRVALPSGIGLPVAEAVLWLGVLLAVAFLIAAIVRGLSRGRAPAPVGEREVTARAAAAAADAPPIPDHARLAAALDFAGALRALLRHAFAAFDARGEALPGQTTGREAVRLARERQLPADDLAALVRAVELAHFGGRPAGRQQYDESLQHLERWRVACAPPR